MKKIGRRTFVADVKYKTIFKVLRKQLEAEVIEQLEEQYERGYTHAFEDIRAWMRKKGAPLDLILAFEHFIEEE